MSSDVGHLWSVYGCGAWWCRGLVVPNTLIGVGLASASALLSLRRSKEGWVGGPSGGDSSGPDIWM